MKLKTLILSLAALAILTACDDGGMFDPDTQTIRADKVWRMNATGVDVRVYEFTPQTAPGKQCVFAAGERKAGLVCFDKE